MPLMSWDLTNALLQTLEDTIVKFLERHAVKKVLHSTSDNRTNQDTHP